MKNKLHRISCIASTVPEGLPLSGLSVWIAQRNGFADCLGSHFIGKRSYLVFTGCWY